MQARPKKAKAYGIRALNAALDGVAGMTAVHICFGYAQTVKTTKPTGYAFLAEFEHSRAQQVSVETAQPKLDCTQLASLSKTIILGVIDLGDLSVETPETVAARIRRALPHVPAERIIVAPDCGMKYLPRDVAFAKMKAMVAGAKIVRSEVAGP
jgi:5-methyltetrahydropteroyltriglutamate--homocysteine methyltransferase